MKPFLTELWGNDSLKSRLAAEFGEGKHSHAYILEGEKGSGKHTLARLLAMSVACARKGEPNVPHPCGECKFCRKIAASHCPDVMTVSREEGRVTMGVDVVRRIREGVSVVPNDLNVKFYVIEDAHTMTVQAQNALLLTLEEPPPFVIFFLLTEDAGALLETVRSRAPIFRLQPVERPSLSLYLTETSPLADKATALKRESPAEFEALLTLSDGKIGTALLLLDEAKRAPLLERRAVTLEILTLLREGGAGDKLLLRLLSLGSKREDLKEQLRMLKIAVRDLALLTKSETAPLLFFTGAEESEPFLDFFATKRLLSYLSAVEEAETSLLGNANVKLTLSLLYTRLIAA